MMPTVSVVIPVYNGERYICESIQSILAQTYQDFEIVVVNDGSTDQTSGLIARFDDDRIRVVENKANLGITKTRNTAVHHARGKYIAVQDCDDFSHPTRLEEQVRFLESNPAFALVASWAEIIREDRPSRCAREVWRFSPNANCISPYLLFHNCIVHSSVMVRRDVLPDPPYRDFEPAEDHDLWVRLARKHKFEIIRRPLVSYRYHADNVSKRLSGKQQSALLRIHRDQLRELGIDPTESELQFHLEMGFPEAPITREQLLKFKKWLMRIIEHNEVCRVYDENELRTAVGKHWMTACKSACRHNPLLFFGCLFSRLGRGHKADFVMSAFRRGFARLC